MLINTQVFPGTVKFLGGCGFVGEGGLPYHELNSARLSHGKDSVHPVNPSLDT